MAKTLVIAEKPSVGRDLTRVLPGAFEKQEGFLESDGRLLGDDERLGHVGTAG